MAASPFLALLLLPLPQAPQDAAATGPDEPAAPAFLAAAVAAPERTEADRRRDATRHPAEVLAFFGIRPGMTVGDVMAGTGYYTEILARALGPEARIYCQNNAFVVERFADAPLTAMLARLEEAEIRTVERLDRELEDPGFPEGELDAAVMVRFYHDTYWQGTDRAKMNAALYRALKPGGIFGVVDHHAEEGSGDRDVQTLHRVDAELVKKEILAAGFELEAESDLLRNPADTRDWNIFDDRAKNRDNTDRFVYRFRKPAE